MSDYRATIGIECHVQLNTKTKLFAAVDNDAREAEPNTLVSPLCFGMPGALPVLNEKAVELAIKAGLALNADIAHYSKFDRKHYFYPDLPLGYQITQYDEPIVLAGNVTIHLTDGTESAVRIHHAHLEADAGKSMHPQGKDYSLVDLNRAGTPLLEIVSEPDMHSPEEAKAYARELYLLMRYAGVSDANLYYGNIRFDVNVSVSGTDALGTRTETKNLNSFRAVEKAVEYEIKRQINELDSGREVVQETRGWDDERSMTFSQRSKENAHDYRYFPDPDLPPIELTTETIDMVRSTMPVMPVSLRMSMLEAGIDKMSVEALLDNPELARRWYEVMQAGATLGVQKKVGDWFANDILALLSQDPSIDLGQDLASQNALNVHELVRLALMVDEKLISNSAAKLILTTSWRDLSDVEAKARDMDLLQVSDVGELEKILEQLLSENPKAVEDIKRGEVKAIGFLVGQAMKATAGKANPGVVQETIKKMLNI